MLLLGLVVLVVGVIGLVLSFFGASIDYKHRSAEILNWDVAPGTLVLWGAVSMLLVVLGLWMMKAGAKQGWRRRKEQKRLTELSDKLDQVELDRRRNELAEDEG
jgi:putative Mn2+ efflux pump MntP